MAEAYLNRNRIVLFGERWSTVNSRNADNVAVSSYGRMAKDHIFIPIPERRGGNRAFDRRIMYGVTLGGVRADYFIENLVYENFVAPDMEVPGPGDVVYMIHLNRNERDNRAANLRRATYDEYYNYMEQLLEPNAVRLRTLRVNEPGFEYNPYYSQAQQVNVRTRYMVSSTGIIYSGHQMQHVNRYQDWINIHGPSVTLQLQQHGIRLPLSRILLDTFQGIHDGMDFPIFLDGDRENLALDNLLHGNEAGFREHMLEVLNRTHDYELFAYVNEQELGYHPNYIISDQARVYSLVTNQWLGGRNNNTTNATLNLDGQIYLRKRLVWEMFRGPLPDGYVILHRQVTNPIDDRDINLEAIPRSVYRGRIRADIRIFQQELQRIEPTLTNLEGELWSDDFSNIQYPQNGEVSNYGRVRIGGQIQRQDDQGTGYFFVLYGGQRYSVHRLCASAWVPNDMPGIRTVVNHINHNTRDNRAENLEWVTALENTLHGLGNAFSARNLDTGEVEYFPTIREAARRGIHGEVFSERRISTCLREGMPLNRNLQLDRAPPNISVRDSPYLRNIQNREPTVEDTIE